MGPRYQYRKHERLRHALWPGVRKGGQSSRIRRATVEIGAAIPTMAAGSGRARAVCSGTDRRVMVTHVVALVFRATSNPPGGLRRGANDVQGCTLIKKKKSMGYDHVAAEAFPNNSEQQDCYGACAVHCDSDWRAPSAKRIDGDAEACPCCSY
jgi:hypothetical protein